MSKLGKQIFQQMPEIERPRGQRTMEWRYFDYKFLILQQELVEYFVFMLLLDARIGDPLASG